ncbi:HD-GYP domain-containing protein [Fervidobacterium thailandense]|uniref:HD-GYP domain-containing protein n=1 Tax=Fervidobacterium thailandense TaxID=1008305 RepID=UPI000845C3D9|nr:HD domain-containing phosphohydrolase [Fervidobacterium thailandense]
MTLRETLAQKFRLVILLTALSIFSVYLLVSFYMFNHYIQQVRKNFILSVAQLKKVATEFFIKEEEDPFIHMLNRVLKRFPVEPDQFERFLERTIDDYGFEELPRYTLERISALRIPNWVMDKLKEPADYFVEKKLTKNGYVESIYVKVGSAFYIMKASGEQFQIDTLFSDIEDLLEGLGIQSLRLYDVELSEVFSISQGRGDRIEQIKLKETLNQVLREKSLKVVRQTPYVFYADLLFLENRKTVLAPLLIVVSFNLEKILYPIFIGFAFIVLLTLLVILIASYISKKFSEEISKPFNALVETMKRTSLRGEFSDDILPDSRIDEVQALLKQYQELRSELSATMEELRASNEELQESYKALEELSAKLEDAYLSFARQLAIIAENYDEETGNHIERVGELSAYLAQKLGLPSELVYKIKLFAPLHDIGKILIPKELLNKPAGLTPEEFEVIKKHTIYGSMILGDKEYFDVARKIALYHHEKYDGSGYPFGLKGEEIPIEARIVALVDVYDALRSRRPYKRALTHEEALEIITKGDERTRPEHFDPQLLKIFLESSEEIKKLWDSLNEKAPSVITFKEVEERTRSLLTP